MKSKRFNKKLSLNKKTIAHLGRHDMEDLKGGIDFVTNTCSDIRPCYKTYTCTCFTHCYQTLCPTSCTD